MDTHGGQTCYLGHRGDQLFARLYNKHAQAPEDYPPGSWRWEVEIKGDTAEQLWKDWQKDWPKADRVSGLVSDYFRRLGAMPAWSSGYSATDWRAPRPRRDSERSMQWFRSQVAGAVSRARGWYSDEEISRALGLEPWEPPQMRR